MSAHTAAAAGTLLRISQHFVQCDRASFRDRKREMIRARVVAGLDRVREQGTKKLGRPRTVQEIEDDIREHLSAGHGILKIAKLVGVGSGTVQRVKREIGAVSQGAMP